MEISSTYPLNRHGILAMLKTCDWSYFPGVDSMHSLLYEDQTHRYIITCSDYVVRVAVLNVQTQRFDYYYKASLSIIFNKLSRKLYLRAQRKLAKLKKSYALVA